MKTQENNHFSWISFVEPIFEDWLFEHPENHIGDVMVSVLASSAIDCWFDPSGRVKPRSVKEKEQRLIV